MFPDQDSCYKWLERVRWNGEPICPHCGGVDTISAPPPSKPHHYWHKECRKHFTATTGTCLHATKKPLQDWIYAVYSVMTARKSVSAMQLSKDLGCQYRTAWYMLQRIREACDSGMFRLELRGTVELDETYVRGKEKNKRKKTNAGHRAVGKAPVVGARERGGDVVAAPVAKVDAATLSEFVRSHVELEATVYTDGATVYEAILPEVYDHDSVQHSRNEWSRGNVHTNFGGVGVEPAQQPVAKVITAFDRPCIPADGVAIRAHTPGMHPNRALSGGRRNGLGARGTFTTDCQASHVRNVAPCLGEAFGPLRQRGFVSAQ